MGEGRYGPSGMFERKWIVRQVVQLVYCDKCHEQVDEGDIQQHVLNYDGTQREFELCPTCEDKIAMEPLSYILTLGVDKSIKPKRATTPKAKPKVTDADVEKYRQQGVNDWNDDPDAPWYECEEHNFSTESPSGMKRHLTRKHT